MFYVYHLIDPTTSQPFYVGKGKNQRAWSHLNENFDQYNLKSKKIAQIRTDGHDPIVKLICENLSETEAWKLEEQEIQKYGRLGIEPNGILTNRTDGGNGGDNSLFFTNTSRTKISDRHTGSKNPNSKLQTSQVIEIFRSNNSTNLLAESYNVSVATICSIKRGYSYKKVTEALNEYPGYDPALKHRFLTPTMVREIYTFVGTTSQIKERFGCSITVARNIKSKYMYANSTVDLDQPGEIILQNLTWDQVCDIRSNTASAKELAKRYSVGTQTIYNIRNGKTRKFY